MRDIYLFQVKSPQECNSRKNIYKLRATVPADEAFWPLKDGKYPDIK